MKHIGAKRIYIRARSAQWNIGALAPMGWQFVLSADRVNASGHVSDRIFNFKRAHYLLKSRPKKNYL